jgi:hypothetical protein
MSGSASANSNGLETSNSVAPGEGIKLHHVICNSELVLKEVIGSGAEGKVGWLAGMLAGYACRAVLLMVCRNSSFAVLVLGMQTP